MEYTYFVVFQAKNEDGRRFGSIDVKTKRKIKDVNNIRNIEKLLAKKHALKGIVITDYKLLNKKLF